MRQIILASQSPRRKELLDRMQLKFDVVPSNFDEYLNNDRSPDEVAKELALGKANDVARLHPDALVIGSDIIVSVGKQQLGKADDEAEAREMLRLVTSQPNRLTASIAVVCLNAHIREAGYEEAWVYFKPYDKALVEQYLSTGDWKDKAAAYGVQSGAAGMVDHIQGNFDTIMGLPTHVLAPMLVALGVPARALDVPLPAELATS